METNKKKTLEQLRKSDTSKDPINMGHGQKSIYDAEFDKQGALLDNFINIVESNPKESINLLHNLNPHDTALIAENLATQKAIIAKKLGTKDKVNIRWCAG